ncbi:MAG: hypothetical protein BGO26_13950 [Actinobacteria bacterium 69-20]|nr:ATP-binding protein [Actinomycetota bacterium]OJV27682.1 MAG: hypothetical protein BGO26_13950 [Actinobacteria bacterium 69-20]
MATYLPRSLETPLREHLRWSGAVVVDGPKAVGKTETGTRLASSHAFLDTDLSLRQLALADPLLVLDGAAPRLLDEWQTVPRLWNAVRHEVDRRRDRGQFILTGSATPCDDETRHTGTGRFSWLRLYPLTMFEAGHSTGEVSLRALMDGTAPRAVGPEATLVDVAERLIIGGWPASHDLPLPQAARYAKGYLDQTAKVDIAAADSIKHDPVKIAALLRSLARTSASEATLGTLAADAGGPSGPLHPDTVSRYLTALQRIFVLEIQEAWRPRLRTRTPLRGAPKRHLVDTSLACAALRIGSVGRLMGDPETLGILFESFVVQQLRAYAALQDAEVLHYRDKGGLEVDAIVQRDDGRWAAFEVKLGPGRIDQGAKSLRKLADVVDANATGPAAALAVVVPTGPSYVRKDGIAVVSLAALGP